MLTRLQGHDEQTIDVESQDGDVIVRVGSDATGLPHAGLSREDAHEALVRAKAKAEDFIAAVEGDIAATEP